MTTHTVLVLGGGTGGITTARALRRRLAPTDRVVLVERSPIFQFAPSFLWVMSGSRRAGQITADVRGLRRRGIEVVEGSVEGIDPQRQRVMTSAGDLSYDRLVVALGAELAPATLPGFAESANNLYTLAGAESANRALAGLDRGRVAILVSRLPYKCPAAPYEAAFLAEAFLRRRGVRQDVAIDVYTPEPLPMPTAGEDVGRAVAAMLKARGIGFHPGQAIERIEGSARRLVFAAGAQVDYDVLIGVPPHRAPAALAESGLAGPSGFVPVDRHSLATALEGIHAIGDATQIPLAGGGVHAPESRRLRPRPGGRGRRADRLRPRRARLPCGLRRTWGVLSRARKRGGRLRVGQLLRGGRSSGADAPPGPALAPGQGCPRALLHAPLVLTPRAAAHTDRYRPPI